MFIFENEMSLLPLTKEADYYNKKTHLKWLNNPDILKWRINKLPYTYENVDKWFASHDNNKAIHFAIINKTYSRIPDKWIGNISLQSIDWINRKAEIAFFIGDITAHGKGFGTRAIKLATKYAFKHLNLNRVYGSTPNPAACRAFEKAGYEKEGVQKSAFYLNNNYIDIYNYGKVKK